MLSFRNVSIVALWWWSWCCLPVWVTTILVHAWTPATVTRIGSRSSSSSTSRSELEMDTSILPTTTELSEGQRTFVMGYINQHHRSTFNIPMVTTFSPVGIEMAKANVWSGGSYTIVDAVLVNVSVIRGMEWNVTIQRRSSVPQHQLVHMSVDAVPNPGRRRDGPWIMPPSSSSSSSSSLRIIATTPIDDLVRRLCAWSYMIDQPTLTGKFIQLALQLDGIGIGKLPENM